MDGLEVMEYRPIGFWKPFACSYRPDPDRPPLGPVIWDTSEAKLLRHNTHLPGLRVDGVLVATYKEKAQ